MEFTVLVTGAKIYQSEYEGRKFSGVKVSYLLSEKVDDGETIGFIPAEAKFDYDLKKRIKDVPGVYTIHGSMVNKKGKTELEYNDLTFVESVVLPWIQS